MATVDGLSLLQDVWASAGKTPMAGRGHLLEISSLTCMVPGWDDSEDGLSCGSQLEPTDGLSVWFETVTTQQLSSQREPLTTRQKL